jgi:hypothetical protein
MRIAPELYLKQVRDNGNVCRARQCRGRGATRTADACVWRRAHSLSAPPQHPTFPPPPCREPSTTLALMSNVLPN